MQGNQLDINDTHPYKRDELDELGFTVTLIDTDTFAMWGGHIFREPEAVNSINIG